MLCWYAWSKRKIYKLLFAAFDEWRSSLHSTIEHPMTVVCEATLGDFLWVKRFSYGIHVATFMRWTRLLQPTMRKPSYSKWLGWDGDAMWPSNSASFDSLELGIPGASWPYVSPRARSPAARRTSTRSSGRPETPSTGARHWHIKSHVKRSKAQKSARNSLKPGESLHVFWGKNHVQDWNLQLRMATIWQKTAFQPRNPSWRTHHKSWGTWNAKGHCLG